MILPEATDGARSAPEGAGGAESRRPSAPLQRLVGPPSFLTAQDHAQRDRHLMVQGDRFFVVGEVAPPWPATWLVGVPEPLVHLPTAPHDNAPLLALLTFHEAGQQIDLWVEAAGDEKLSNLGPRPACPNERGQLLHFLFVQSTIHRGGPTPAG